MRKRKLGYSLCPQEVWSLFFVYFLCTVITDHQDLCYTYQKRGVHGRLARWLNFLAERTFKTSYRLGNMDAPASYLSRLDLASPVEPGYDEVDLACTTVSTEDFSRLETHLVSIAT